MALREGDALAQLLRVVRPVQDAEPRRPDPIDERLDGGVTGRGRAELLVQQHGSESCRLMSDQVVALPVPRQLALAVDAAAERGDQLVRGNSRADSHSGAAAVAVEIGGDDE